MFRKKKRPETENRQITAATETDSGEEAAVNEEVKFQKNIKTLWIYTTLFCLFALFLIIISSVIQNKIHSEAEYYQDRYDEAQTSNQSTIKNIQDENNILKAEIEKCEKECEMLRQQAEADAALIADSTELLTNAEYLLNAQIHYQNGSDDLMKQALDAVNPDMLSVTMREVYDTLRSSIGE